MIASGIRFLCRKVVDLVNLADEHGLDFDSQITFSQIKHSEWVNRMLAMIENLKNWELKHNGEPTFSKSFDLLSVKLSVGNTERRKLLKNSSSRKMIENSSQKVSDRPTDFSATRSHRKQSPALSHLNHYDPNEGSTQQSKIMHRNQDASPYTLKQSNLPKDTELYREY